MSARDVYESIQFYAEQQQYVAEIYAKKQIGGAFMDAAKDVQIWADIAREFQQRKSQASMGSIT